MSTKHLTMMTIILFVVSLFVYSFENHRGTDLLTGSDYIKGLDVNKIQKIVLKFEGKEKITLNRDSQHFVLENKKSYPADTQKINELIYKIASIQVQEMVSSNSSEEELKKYELNEGAEKYLVEIYDTEGKKTVAFRVGKNYKSKGNYLYRLGKDEIYLSNSSVWLNSSYKDFIDTLLLKIDTNKVSELEVNTDKAITVSDQDKINKYTKEISSIYFKDFYLPTEPKIQSLDFSKQVKVKLKNKLIYNLNLAKNKDEYFVKVNALLDEMPSKFVVGKDDKKEDLQKIEDVIQAQAEAQKINQHRAGWIYQVDKKVYENLNKQSKFFTGQKS